ncbi:sugar phosphate isomerase/epimerase family protein [Paenibacillus humicola]|uniref:sugar phosphate isomerase/epimerase family protein n=1 Tax=Paenibacillus humicola TaxID=3110540 RepID=UPI00237A87ED|nr:sugar phosphate isomerase/epimerase family protein [Paenibacillus humicola]
MKIAFQTLACPDWEWAKIVQEARRMGYDGIELRGINGEMYLPKAPPFLEENIAQTMAGLREAGLAICCLDSSCAFHDPQKWEGAVQEGCDYIDLAVKLGVPFVRVFGDALPEREEQAVTLERIAKGLTVLGRYAEGKGVTVLLETHGDIRSVKLIKAIFAQTDSGAVGLLWDFEHPYLHGEEPEVTFGELSAYIKHTHVKDAKRLPDGKKLCLIGEGDVPVARMIRILRENGYDGWLSLEFEKKWAPYLEEPEVSLPAFRAFCERQLV